ncbi:MAG: hypothetical protein KAU46_11200 [Candidatus Aminicenantes bacterium]|nr:hypothetical protein [Candidatus Aminicenantes bacterium]
MKTVDFRRRKQTAGLLKELIIGEDELEIRKHMGYPDEITEAEDRRMGEKRVSSANLCHFSD